MWKIERTKYAPLAAEGVENLGLFDTEEEARIAARDYVLGRRLTTREEGWDAYLLFIELK